MPFRRVTTLAALLVALALPVAAQAPPVTEYEIKAAFLFNFAKFVEWPPNAFATSNAPLVIGVLGTDPFGFALDQIVANKSISGHPFVIRRLKDESAAAGCHILFVSSSERASLQRLIPLVAHRSVLTVGETEDFAEAGGVVEFFMQDNKVRLEINPSAAEQAGLKISAQLMRLGSPMATPPRYRGE